jgi:hypothetical protein
MSDDDAVFGGVWCRIPCGVPARVAIGGREGWHHSEACTGIACLVKGVRGFVGERACLIRLGVSAGIEQSI